MGITYSAGSVGAPGRLCRALKTTTRISGATSE